MFVLRRTVFLHYPWEKWVRFLQINVHNLLFFLNSNIVIFFCEFHVGIKIFSLGYGARGAICCRPMEADVLIFLLSLFWIVCKGREKFLFSTFRRDIYYIVRGYLILCAFLKIILDKFNRYLCYFIVNITFDRLKFSYYCWKYVFNLLIRYSSAYLIY